MMQIQPLMIHNITSSATIDHVGIALVQASDNLATPVPGSQVMELCLM